MGDPIASDWGDFGRATCGTGEVKPQQQLQDNRMNVRPRGVERLVRKREESWRFLGCFQGTSAKRWTLAVPVAERDGLDATPLAKRSLSLTLFCAGST